ncbi:MAG: response regulator transcription factor [Clostridiales bacterium]|nr:response regulator transcription factor [Clostridiales bacterium]
MEISIFTLMMVLKYLLQYLKTRSDSVKVVIVDDYIIKALNLGAKGYMLKQNYESIVPSIKAVYAGQNVFGDEIITKIAEGLSNKEISEILFFSEGTIRNNISTILEKLNLRDRTQIAIFYYKNIQHHQLTSRNYKIFINNL